MNKIAIALSGIVVLVGVSFCLSSGTHSDSVAKAPPDGIERVCETIVDHACRGEKDALDLINENTISRPTSTSQKELQEATWRNQKAGFADLQEKFGPYLGCELAEQKDISGSVRERVYVAKYQRNVMRWTFVLYRPRDKWKILSNRFKDLSGE